MVSYKFINLEALRDKNELNIDTYAKFEYDGSDIDVFDQFILKKKGNTIELLRKDGNVDKKYEQVQEIQQFTMINMHFSHITNTDGTSFVLNMSEKTKINDDTIMFDKDNNSFCKNGVAKKERDLYKMDHEQTYSKLTLNGYIAFCSFYYDEANKSTTAMFQYEDNSTEVWDINEKKMIWRNEDGLTGIEKGIIIKQRKEIETRSPPNFHYLYSISLTRFEQKQFD